MGSNENRKLHWRMSIEEMEIGQIVCYSVMGLLCQMKVASIDTKRNRVILTDNWGETVDIPVRLVYRYAPPGCPCLSLSYPSIEEIERARFYGGPPSHDVIGDTD